MCVLPVPEPPMQSRTEKTEQPLTPRRQPRRQLHRAETSSESKDDVALAQQVQELRAELLTALEAIRADMRQQSQPGPSSRHQSPEGDRTQQAASAEESEAQ
jgi:hypothetical protein